MGQRRQIIWIYAFCVVLSVTLLFQSKFVFAAQASSLSKWLSQQAVPQLRERLGRHPRYENQRIAVVSSEADALSAAVVTVLLRSFPGKYGVQLQPWQASVAVLEVAVSSIDGLRCAGTAAVDYLLQVSATRSPAGGDELRLQLAAVQDQATATDVWHWSGRFSTAERSYLQQPAGSRLRDGSLAAPWRETDADAAARVLTRDFACALRPQLQTRLALDWHEHPALPGVFSDTVNISRQILGDFRELGVAAEAADLTEAAHAGARQAETRQAETPAAETALVEAAFAVDVRLVPLRENLWQLWLIGAPRQPGLAPVQAVTYFSVTSPQWPRQSAPDDPLAVVTTPPPRILAQDRPRPDAKPLDYLDVKLLDATQTDGRGSHAALQVTLQLDNRAQWPMEYSFTLSGGHFNDCVATPDYYRHDRYGSVAGNLAAGESVVRRLVIENAEHRPTPIFGMRKCAGFRDLEGFEDFGREGYRVTDYVRWKM